MSKIEERPLSEIDNRSPEYGPRWWLEVEAAKYDMVAVDLSRPRLALVSSVDTHSSPVYIDGLPGGIIAVNGRGRSAMLRRSSGRSDLVGICSCGELILNPGYGREQFSRASPGRYQTFNGKAAAYDLEEMIAEMLRDALEEVRGGCDNEKDAALVVESDISEEWRKSISAARCLLKKVEAGGGDYGPTEEWFHSAVYDELRIAELDPDEHEAYLHVGMRTDDTCLWAMAMLHAARRLILESEEKGVRYG